MSGRSDPAAARWGGPQDEPGPRASAEGGPAPAGPGSAGRAVRGVAGAGDAADDEPRAGEPVTGPRPARNRRQADAAGAGPGVVGEPAAGTGPADGTGPAPAGHEPDTGGTAGRQDGAAANEEEEKKENGDVTPGTILTDIVALTAERDDYLQSLQRLKADFDNYRKRVQRLQDEQAARAAADLVAKLLPVLDNLDLAWVHLGRDAPATEEARALGQARAQLLDVLSKEGLERVDAEGVPFDPMVHDAVAHAAAQPSDGPDGAEVSAGTDGTAGEAGEVEGRTSGDASADGAPADNGASGQGVSVDEVMRAGYRWRGKVLRPAMVRVRG
jgi:molecular chaperone GrpE